MPSQTPNLDLYKVNGETDGNDTFNVDVVLNDNWDKIDAAVGGVETEIEGLKQSGVDGKNRLETAIIAKEGTVSKQGQVATFAELDTGIRSIPTGTDTSDATAAAGDIISSKTAYVKGVKVTGTIPDRGAGGTVTPGTTNQTKQSGYYSDVITILGDADLKASNLPKDVNIFNVQGVLERMTTTERNAIIAAIVAKGVAASANDSNTVLAQKIGQIKTGSRSFFDFATPEYSYDRTMTIKYKDMISIPAGTGFVDFYSILTDLTEGALEAATYFRNHTYSYTVEASLALIDTNGLILTLISEQGIDRQAIARILGFYIDRAAKQVIVTTHVGANGLLSTTLSLPTGFNSTGVIRLCAGHTLRSYGGSTTSVMSGKNNARKVFMLGVN